ncbi:MAG: plastocyanin/azurin family copper-binding protein [Aestuariivirga sp.]
MTRSTEPRSIVLAAAFAAALAVLPLSAFPHGDAKHDKKAAKPISTEEKEFGREGDPKKASRTVRIDMSDKMRFTPASLTVKQGDTVKFVVKNSGKVMHEMVIGTIKELKEHAEMMRKHPTMEHDEPYMAHVPPGKTETMVWQFTKTGDFNFGCLVPGHFEAGMIGKVTVK